MEPRPTGPDLPQRSVTCPRCRVNVPEPHVRTHLRSCHPPTQVEGQQPAAGVSGLAMPWVSLGSRPSQHYTLLRINTTEAEHPPVGMGRDILRRIANGWHAFQFAKAVQEYTQLVRDVHRPMNPADVGELSCFLCGVVKPITQHRFLDGCTHSACRECLRGKILRRMKDRTCIEMKCDFGGCEGLLTQADVKDVLLAEEFEDYLQETFAECVSANPDFVRCPNGKCVNVMERINSPQTPSGSTRSTTCTETSLTSRTLRHKNTHRFNCRECNTDFCAKCSTIPYHEGNTCKGFTASRYITRCRYCGAQMKEARNRRDSEKIYDEWPGSGVDNTPPSCGASECKERALQSCQRTHGCGHPCCGVLGEINCLPCIHPDCTAESNAKQSELDFCAICYIEELKAAPCIKLTCGHVFHFTCVKNRIENGWPGSRITFGYLACAICKERVEHPALTDVLSFGLDLYEQVVEKALQRLRMLSAEERKGFRPGNHQESLQYALNRFSYYLCFKCKKPYFGGDKMLCQAEENIREIKQEELVCGSCCDFGDTKDCSEHGKEYIEYKCRFCCDLAVWFCWGTTHFCDKCHKNAAELLTARPQDLPACQCGYAHPPNGEEFCLGCAYCRAVHN
eukprot:TRINITY_DN3641_c0_g1_i1.p1 TRINITY_DN3641_c0_g1~~TRINITY_DN3641_c0_g1_i1.p1  ORF type:complete len:704 (+),score=3.84 TRINITY_DN3641_c0_g1_i1:246-2114(+)